MSDPIFPMLFYGAGKLADLGGAFSAAQNSVGRALIHAAAGCINAQLSGGECGKGAVTAGFSKFLSAKLPFAGMRDPGPAVLRAAIIGGTVSVLGGGKFANGAQTAAFQEMFNALLAIPAAPALAGPAAACVATIWCPVLLGGGALLVGGGKYLYDNIVNADGKPTSADGEWDTGAGQSNGMEFPDRDLPRDKHGNPTPDPDAEGPHTQLGQRDSKKGGRYPQAREFDANGKPVRDIDFTDHGRGHPNPHYHPYVPNSTGGTPQRSKEHIPLKQ